MTELLDHQALHTSQTDILGAANQPELVIIASDAPGPTQPDIVRHVDLESQRKWVTRAAGPPLTSSAIETKSSISAGHKSSAKETFIPAYEGSHRVNTTESDASRLERLTTIEQKIGATASILRFRDGYGSRATDRVPSLGKEYRSRAIKQLADEGVDMSPHTKHIRDSKEQRRLEAEVRRNTEAAKRAKKTSSKIALVPTANHMPVVAAVAAVASQPIAAELDTEPAAAMSENEKSQTPVVARVPANGQQPTPTIQPNTLDSFMKSDNSLRPRHRAGFLERMRSRQRSIKNEAILIASGAGRSSREQRDPEELRKRNGRLAAIGVAIGAVALFAVAARTGNHDAHSTIVDLLPKQKGGQGGHQHAYNVAASKSLAPKPHLNPGMGNAHNVVSLRSGNNDWTIAQHALGHRASRAQVNRLDHVIMHLNHQTEDSARHQAIGSKVKLPVKLIASIRKSIYR